MTEINKKSLEVLFASPVTDEMIKFLTDSTLRVVPNVPDTRKQSYPSPPNSPSGKGQSIPSLMTFISRLVRYTNVYTSTLLTTAVYLRRLRKILPRDAAGLPSTCHRIFLACLILSAKYHNDSSPLNKHWTKYTDGLFTLRDVNLMERQLLQLLRWDIRAEVSEICEVLHYFVDPIKIDLGRSAKLYRQIRNTSEQLQPKHTLDHLHQRTSSTCSSTKTVCDSRSTSINSLDVLKEYEDDDCSSSKTLLDTRNKSLYNTYYTQYV